MFYFLVSGLGWHTTTRFSFSSALSHCTFWRNKMLSFYIFLNLLEWNQKTLCGLFWQVFNVYTTFSGCEATFLSDLMWYTFRTVDYYKNFLIKPATAQCSSRFPFRAATAERLCLTYSNNFRDVLLTQTRSLCQLVFALDKLRKGLLLEHNRQ